ncbi:MAG: choice-of-anchor O protein, partial [Wenzhouxiangella sp.]|nr:choice-of-anchor O protein [Wenzhouxiangella sp.]
QGDFAQGGPSDIMLRRAVGGYDPQHIVPAIDIEPTGIVGQEQERCRAHVNNELIEGLELLDDPLTDIRFGTEHLPAINFSGTAAYLDPPGTAPDAETGLNPFEDALAHRGQLRGDQIIVGFSHVPDQARFRFLDDAIPYNFYIRSSQDGGDTWSAAVNVSNLTPESGLSAREPRIVGTPGNGPGCSDPLNPTDPTDCANPNIVYFGFGTQTNVTNLEEAEDVDIFMGATQDGGLTFSPVQAVTAGDALNELTDDDADLETQLKLRPDGLKGYVVWTSTPPGGTDDSLFRRLQINLDRIFRDRFEAPSD